jgi:hypothetical protein
MRALLILCIGMAALLGAAGVVAPADTMRCGSRLISVGDPADKLLVECGSPTTVDEWEEERFYYFDTPPPPEQYRTFERHERGYRVRAFVKVELWTYNNGPSRFIEYVRIENGRIRKIETGKYGY